MLSRTSCNREPKKFLFLPNPAVSKIIDLSQFGGIPCSSATQELISMVHSWAKETDGTGCAVRVALFDYRKAFDLKDLHILAKKVSFLSMPLFVKHWVIDFLMNRQQLLPLVINDLQPP